jgi:predicted metal-dependent peptidase
VEDAGASPAERGRAESEWKVAVAQAAEAARKRGAVPAGLARLVGEALAPKADWKAALREFVSGRCEDGRSWRRPRRAMAAQGVYLPGPDGERLGRVCVAIDTSGSVGPRELAVFASEVQAILDAFDCELTLVYHDAAVCHVQTWRSSDGPLALEPRGGGGTDHRPVFDWAARLDEPPVCVVCLTDLCSVFPPAPPDYPVLWASTVKGRKGPWGQTLEVSADV